MLLLSRKMNEDIMIGDDICIRVIAVNRSKVVLGVSAPKGIPIHRLEVYHRIKLQLKEKLGLQRVNDKTYTPVHAAT